MQKESFKVNTSSNKTSSSNQNNKERNDNKPSVYFFRIDILFKPNELNIKLNNNMNTQESLNISLFKIFTMNVFEVEMCTFSIDKNFISTKIAKKLKFICFHLQANNKSPYNRINSIVKESTQIKTCMLTLLNSKISKFHQVIRASENSILSIDNCFIDLSYGKSIVMLNPLAVKIINTKFEYNMNNCIQIKIDMRKRDISHCDNKFNLNNYNNNSLTKVNNNIFNSKINFLNNSNSQDINKKNMFFSNNTFLNNYGNAIYIEGSNKQSLDNLSNKEIPENLYKPYSKSITCLNNLFQKNKYNGIYLTDLNYSNILIEGNKFINNEENGIFLKKINLKNTNNSHIMHLIHKNNYKEDNFNNNSRATQTINIRRNNFVENKGFGLFVNNNVLVKVFENDFVQNKAGGIILCDLNIKTLKDKFLKKVNLNNNETEGINKDNTTLNKNYMSSINQVLSCNTSKSQSDRFSQKINFYLKAFSDEISFIYKSNFIKNGGSGIKLLNYSNFILIDQCNSSENVEYGLSMESDEPVKDKKIELFKNFCGNKNEKKKIIEYFDCNNLKLYEYINDTLNYKNIDSDYNYNYNNTTKNQSQNLQSRQTGIYSSNINLSNLNSNDLIKNTYYNFLYMKIEDFPIDSNVVIYASNLESNLRSGIYLRNQLLYLHSTCITENIFFAIEIPTEKQKNYFKTNRSISDSLKGSVGGDWGQISYISKFSCSCSSLISKKKCIDRKLILNFRKEKKENEENSIFNGYNTFINKDILNTQNNKNNNDSQNKDNNNKNDYNIYKQNNTESYNCPKEIIKEKPKTVFLNNNASKKEKSCIVF